MFLSPASSSCGMRAIWIWNHVIERSTHSRKSSSPSRTPNALVAAFQKVPPTHSTVGKSTILPFSIEVKQWGQKCWKLKTVVIWKCIILNWAEASGVGQDSQNRNFSVNYRIFWAIFFSSKTFGKPIMTSEHWQLIDPWRINFNESITIDCQKISMEQLNKLKCNPIQNPCECASKNIALKDPNQRKVFGLR